MYCICGHHRNTKVQCTIPTDAFITVRILHSETAPCEHKSFSFANVHHPPATNFHWYSLPSRETQSHRLSESVGAFGILTVANDETTKWLSQEAEPTRKSQGVRSCVTGLFFNI